MFIDLDNTIADTWPLRKDMTTFMWHLTPPIYPSIQFIKNELEQKKYYPIILSARPARAYLHTLEWVKNNTTFFKKNLFFTPTSEYKIKYFNAVIKRGTMGAIIDDCSYGHEFGTVSFHLETIEYICRNQITFYDYNFILNLKNT